MDQPDGEQAPVAGGVGRAVLVYTLGRLGLFVAVALLVNLLTGLNGPLLLLLALLVSSLLAFVLLRRQRDALAAAVEARGRHRASRDAALRARLDDPDAP